jgi:hypothetical protein
MEEAQEAPRKRPREEPGAPAAALQSPDMLLQWLSRVIMMAGTQVLQASVVPGGDQEHDPLWLVRPRPKPLQAGAPPLLSPRRCLSPARPGLGEGRWSGVLALVT